MMQMRDPQEYKEVIENLQSSLLGKWDPNSNCKVHPKSKQLEFDKYGIPITLHLCELDLSQIPSQVWSFDSLEELFLVRNRLITLPAYVNELSSDLRWLSLSGNQLHTLRAELCELDSLEGLDLSNNQLSALPAELRKLSFLKVLDLSGNLLSTLPAELYELDSLLGLDLSNNQLSTLPAELRNLTSLEILDLSNNQFSALPVELGHLSSLRDLDLKNNPLLTPPPKVIEQGISAIIAYLRAYKPQSASSYQELPGYPQAADDPYGRPFVQPTPAASYQASPAIQPDLDEGGLSRTSTPLEIFCCYAREDQEMLARLKKHLMPLQRQGQITLWSDTDLNAGIEWEKELHRHLESADLILLLISPDFMNSDYCYSTEMKRAIERHNQSSAQVIPILLRPTFWRNAPFAKLQVLPKDAKPVNSWADMDEAFNDITEHIYQLL